MKSKDPDCKIPISKEEYRCFKCELPAANESGGWNEIESGIDAKVCAECYKPKKDLSNEEVQEKTVLQP